MLIQTQGTCYFYSVLNTLADTRGGRILLLVKMKEFLSKLSTAQREIFFNHNVCIKYSNLPSVKRFIFFKFIYNYWTGYTELKGSVKLLQNLNMKDFKLQGGDFMAPARKSIFSAVGIHKELWAPGRKYKPTTECVVQMAFEYEHKNYRLNKPTDISVFLPGDPDFLLDSATIIMNNGPGKPAHAIACVRFPNNTFELVDSVGYGKRYKCDWTHPAEVEKVWKRHYSKRYTVGWDYTSIMYIKTKNLPEFSLKGLTPKYSSSNDRYSPTSSRHPPISPIYYASTSPAPHGRNSLGRKIMKGPRGGFYVMVGASKKYGAKPTSQKLSPKKPSPPKIPSPPKKSPSPHGRNSLGRKIMKGPRGGLYVMVGAVKKYGAKPTTK